jgi:septal ring factor EnvC (AmiA/AmiB activator)
MQNKQRGSFLIGGIAALVIAGIIGFIGYSHGSSKEKAETERVQGLLTAKTEELRQANEKVEQLAKALEQKDREIKLMQDTGQVNQQVILERERTIDKLEDRIKKLSTALPVPKKRDPSKPIVEAEESDSMKRYDVLFAVYQEVAEIAPVPVEVKPKENKVDVPKGATLQLPDLSHYSGLDWLHEERCTFSDLNPIVLSKELT